MTARRELGYVEFLQGRYAHAQRWLADALAEARAIGDPGEEAQAQSALGSVLSDQGSYGPALARLAAAVAGATAVGDHRGAAYAGTMLGRAHLLRDELGAARHALDDALGATHRAGWLAFAPWPEAWLAGVDLAEGDVDAASARYEHAFAVGCQIGDPCWEGIAACGLGLVHEARGEADEARAALADAAVRCVRAPDGYLWVKGYVLDALCRVCLASDPAAAPAWVGDLHDLASRTGMRELVARAHLHRAALGEDGALVAAATAAADVDNPALAALLAEAGA